MTVILTSPVEGKQPGDTYTGANEAYLLASGYARKAKSGELQTLTEGGSGLTSFTITHSGQTTGAIAAAASAATVEAALVALSNVAPGDVKVSGSAGGPYTLRWAEGVTHALVTATPTGGSGTVTVANLGSSTFTGPGLDNTGASDTSVANNREFDATRGDIAVDSSLGDGGGTNTNVVLAPADAPELSYTGTDGPAPEVTPYATFDGFANEPTTGYPLVVATVTKADGTAATGLAAVGGASLRAKGRGFRKVTKFQVGGIDATALVKLSDQEATFTAPAKAAGTYDVVAVRTDGNVTKTGAVTYV